MLREGLSASPGLKRSVSLDGYGRVGWTFLPQKEPYPVTRPIHDIASDVAAHGGDVHVDGPDGVAFSLTPDAAAETSHRLLHGAAMAQGQRLDQGGEDDKTRR